MTCVPQPDPDVIATAMPDGDTILLHLRTSQYFSLNGTGSLLWQLMQSSTSLDQMGEALLDRFEMTSDAARQCVLELVGDLKRHQLISVLPTEDSAPHE